MTKLCTVCTYAYIWTQCQQCHHHRIAILIACHQTIFRKIIVVIPIVAWQRTIQRARVYFAGRAGPAHLHRRTRLDPANWQTLILTAFKFVFGEFRVFALPFWSPAEERTVSWRPGSPIVSHLCFCPRFQPSRRMPRQPHASCRRRLTAFNCPASIKPAHPLYLNPRPTDWPRWFQIQV